MCLSIARKSLQRMQLKGLEQSRNLTLLKEMLWVPGREEEEGTKKEPFGINSAVSSYIESVQQLEVESRIPNHFVVCDNIDLETIIQDFESYYYVRLHKYPIICKKIETPAEPKRKPKIMNIEKKDNNSMKKLLKDNSISKEEISIT
uniref:Uncharacterized protein n=1 Tax=Rhodnius prolixus TaxID=13249 RepID=T1I5V2_RHOPR